MRKIEQVIDDIKTSIEIDKPEVAKCYEPYFREILEIHKAEKNGIPLDDLRTEIGKSKTEHEMQIAEKDIKAKLLISDIYCDIVNILDKYKTESEETDADSNYYS